MRNRAVMGNAKRRRRVRSSWNSGLACMAANSAAVGAGGGVPPSSVVLIVRVLACDGAYVPRNASQDFMINT